MSRKYLKMNEKKRFSVISEVLDKYKNDKNFIQKKNLILNLFLYPHYNFDFQRDIERVKLFKPKIYIHIWQFEGSSSSGYDYILEKVFIDNNRFTYKSSLKKHRDKVVKIVSVLLSNFNKNMSDIECFCFLFKVLRSHSLSKIYLKTEYIKFKYDRKGRPKDLHINDFIHKINEINDLNTILPFPKQGESSYEVIDALKPDKEILSELELYYQKFDENEELKYDKIIFWDKENFIKEHLKSKHLSAYDFTKDINSIIATNDSEFLSKHYYSISFYDLLYDLKQYFTATKGIVRDLIDLIYQEEKISLEYLCERWNPSITCYNNNDFQKQNTEYNSHFDYLKLKSKNNIMHNYIYKVTLLFFKEYYPNYSELSNVFRYNKS